MSTQIQLFDTKLTSQEIEQALINVVKAGIYYRRPKDGKFMQSYKERIKKLRQAKDPEEYVLKLAQTIFPNKDKYHQIMDDYKSYYGKDPKILNSIMELYKLYYRLAKDYFIIETKIDEEIEDFLNS
ncbi:hypothetical protein RclHR1_01220036 [Rhizophagus clarus]|uniref:Uncharacterized protein n=1 Tax=Rhizophagus clarus TaxID=94130 RepID=A0A2Z6Q6J9_9GLOM|nr:hypothetical protein RclHR1_01220036 [Rhizophagus clarus]GES85751.1 hypothetical protein GLOIN_2v1489479 [Rhizophagus clarus]